MDKQNIISLRLGKFMTGCICKKEFIPTILKYVNTYGIDNNQDHYLINCNCTIQKKKLIGELSKHNYIIGNMKFSSNICNSYNKQKVIIKDNLIYDLKPIQVKLIKVKSLKVKPLKVKLLNKIQKYKLMLKKKLMLQKKKISKK